MKPWAKDSAPLLLGGASYVLFLLTGKRFLADGDTLWHIAVGRWIIENKTVPTTDYFSHTFFGEPWVAHEWLSEVILAYAYDYGGWGGLVCLTALFAALAISLQLRYLSRYLHSSHLIIIGLLTLALVQTHMLARPHVLAFPLMVLWIGHLVVACDQLKSPDWRMLVVVVLWANIHGGVTLGIAFLFPFMIQIAFSDLPWIEKRSLLLKWFAFTAGAIVAACMTPQGVHTLLFAFRILGDSYMMATIGEWKSPNFHKIQPLEVWLLLIISLALLTNLKVHWVRCVLLLGLLHLSLKHIRNVEILGLLSPLILASALSDLFRAKGEGADHFHSEISKSKSIWLSIAVVVFISTWFALRYVAYEPTKRIFNPEALLAVDSEGVSGKVLNSYSLGGFLIFSGVPPFIDGRADMYGSDFLENYMKSKSVRDVALFQDLLKEHDISWTLFLRKESAIGVLDVMPEWRRIYEDEQVVVHAKSLLGDL